MRNTIRNFGEACLSCHLVIAFWQRQCRDQMTMLGFPKFPSIVVCSSDMMCYGYPNIRHHALRTCWRVWGMSFHSTISFFMVHGFWSRGVGSWAMPGARWRAELRRRASIGPCRFACAPRGHTFRSTQTSEPSNVKPRSDSRCAPPLSLP